MRLGIVRSAVVNAKRVDIVLALPDRHWPAAGAIEPAVKRLVADLVPDRPVSLRVVTMTAVELARLPDGGPSRPLLF